MKLPIDPASGFLLFLAVATIYRHTYPLQEGPMSFKNSYPPCQEVQLVM